MDIADITTSCGRLVDFFLNDGCLLMRQIIGDSRIPKTAYREFCGETKIAGSGQPQ
jgi:hypothetical protein